MISAIQDDHVLIGQLLDFHAALVRIKRGIVPPDGIPVLTAPDSEDSVPATAQLAHALRSVLDLQSAQALEYSGRQGHEQAEAARYLKVALADETLIALQDWPQRHDWIGCPLEFQLYGSRSAGERIFDRIAGLLQTQPGSQRELAQLYLMALSMGFQGRYRKQEGGQSDLLAWRRKLYRHAYGRWPDSALGGDDGLQRDLAMRRMPQPYQYTHAGIAPRLLPNPRRWAAYFVLLVLGLLLLSQFAWQTDTAELRAELAKVEDPLKGSDK
ncbi:DotU family type IV/VI secretion system protein [Pseudoduganella violaceinigra]|uniref:DotU family type IV/VI secretion system protein n=1 Tax=Pseudoduganella violaceinigra TaxID=246602 RepID=UPI0003F4B1F0|nr:DotU family type IV/VI secretion system protein [Pseudoduganella violaceinigra]